MEEFIAGMRNGTLRQIAEKVVNGIPVSAPDALAMLTTHDVLELGCLANFVKQHLHGDNVFYSVNMNLNYTNICELRCPLCAFSCGAGDPGAYLLSLDEIEARVKTAVADGIDEVHIVGGLNPALRIAYFEAMLKRIKAVKPDIFIVAFTAVEYDYFARLNGIPLDEVFTRLQSAGLGALPGGGAEIFAPHIRAVIAPRKITGERWLEVMATAHAHGLKTNASLLYNHIERPEDIVDHLVRIRNLQDETAGFKTFVPLVFHGAHTAVPARRPESTGFDDIRVFATTRIFLHNIPHLKAHWMYLGEKTAQTLLNFGVDDLSGTYTHERVVHSAGAVTPDQGSERHIRTLIELAGLTPVRATADYTPRSLS